MRVFCNCGSGSDCIDHMLHDSVSRACISHACNYVNSGFITPANCFLCISFCIVRFATDSGPNKFNSGKDAKSFFLCDPRGILSPDVCKNQLHFKELTCHKKGGGILLTNCLCRAWSIIPDILIYQVKYTECKLFSWIPGGKGWEEPNISKEQSDHPSESHADGPRAFLR